MSGPSLPGDPGPDLSRTSAYDYTLPEGRIARYPAERREASRLLVFPRGAVSESSEGGSLAEAPDGAARRAHAGGRVRNDSEDPPFRHMHFSDLPTLLAPGDLLVLNESRVLPVRLLGTKPTGAACEVLLLRPCEGDSAGGVPRWEALVRPGSKLKPGRELRIAPGFTVVIEAGIPDGGRIVRLEGDAPLEALLERHGRIPLPPYLDRAEEPIDRERYQTVYARDPGSVAAPTAGLHFTADLLEEVRVRGVEIAHVTLHVGPGTFRPVDSESIEAHRLHRERWALPEGTARAIESCRARGGRVWAVGTTVVRTLESAAVGEGEVRPGRGDTELFIRPGFSFRIVDGLVTNFHLPRSTLLMLVAAFAGYRATMRAYEVAVAEGYRFYSYGDAMAITPLPRTDDSR